MPITLQSVLILKMGYNHIDNLTKSYEKMGLELNIGKTHVLLQKAPCENVEQPDIKIHDEM